MDKLLKDLEAVALLVEKATPGEWDVFVRRGGMLDVGASHNCTVACTAVPVVGDCEANAHLIVRAVNFLRTHRAEIAEAVADARRYQWLRSQDRLAHASMTEDHAPYAIHIGVANDSDIWGLAGDHADQMIDAAIDAQHSSALEG